MCLSIVYLTTIQPQYIHFCKMDINNLILYIFSLLEKNTFSKHYKNNVEQAIFYKSICQGKNQSDFIKSYRIKETKAQQEQRDRITLTKTKHVAGQVEMCLDLLKTFDRPAKIIEGKNDALRLKDYVYNNNIEKIAYEYVKHYNLVDSNAFCVAGKNEYGDIIFTPIQSVNVIDSLIVNDNLRYLAIRRQAKDYNSYTIYTNNEIVIIENAKSGLFKSDLVKTILKDSFYITVIKTKRNYAFRLGYNKSVETNFETCNSILEPASELFKSLMWEGSELDVIKATHGIVKQFAYAQRCNYSYMDKDVYKHCDNGMISNCEIPTSCPKCSGGLKIHTSSQDIIFIEEPIDSTNVIPLSNQIHVEYIPPEILEYRKNDLKETEEKIYKTVFASNYLTKGEISATATEKRMDQQGLYSALGKLGSHVSDCFIWMCECIIDINGWKDVEVFHGYSLDLKLDTVETLIEKRTKAKMAGVPIEIINVLDYAIMKKQNVDNPKVLENMSAWERFKPLSDKTDIERVQILAGLSSNDRLKVLWVYFGQIKNDIIAIRGDDFYTLKYENQKQLIDDEVSKIIENIKGNESLKINFND
jgi:hypothetical protein